jgi:hypothetical protein
MCAPGSGEGSDLPLANPIKAGCKSRLMIVIADQLDIDEDVFETWPRKLCQRCASQSASNFAGRMTLSAFLWSHHPLRCHDLRFEEDPKKRNCKLSGSQAPNACNLKC